MDTNSTTATSKSQESRLQKVRIIRKGILPNRNEYKQTKYNDAVEEKSSDTDAGEETDLPETIAKVFDLEAGVDDERGDSDGRNRNEPSQTQDDDVV